VESTITRKGQATIPKVVRERLRLKPGDRLKFFMHPEHLSQRPRPHGFWNEYTASERKNWPVRLSKCFKPTFLLLKTSRKCLRR
jgi:AbrB family looped-hinge helix DNA binding protein